MALNFPSNPSLNDTYSIGGRTYVYNGYAWQLPQSNITTDVVVEASNLYFTNARAVAALTGQGFITNTALNVYATNAQLSLYATNTSPTFTGTVTITGNTTSLGYFSEKTNVISSAFTSNNNYNINDGIVHYHTTDASANGTVNLQGFSSVQVNNTTSVVVMVTNGATAYKVNTVQIDGAAPNVVKWSGGIAPTQGYASNIDVYGFSVVKTGVSTFTVLASQSNFG